MIASDYLHCAQRIAEALKLQTGERVLIKLDIRVFTGIVEPLQREVRKTGAVVAAVILAEDTTEQSQTELEVLRRLFDTADVFIWLPELQQGHRPALAKALIEWLDSKRGRALHFHWHSGTYPIGSLPLPPQDVIDQIYLRALDVSPDELGQKHRNAI